MAWNTPITWATGAVTASQFNAQIRDNMNWLKGALTQLNVTSDSAKAKITPALCGARVNKSGLQTISTGTATAITFDQERFDSDAFHSTVTNTSRMTIPSGMDGYYLIGGNINWAGGATGIRDIAIRLNGTTYIAYQREEGLDSNDLPMNITTFYQLAAADYVELYVNQTSGGNLNVFSSANYSPEFWITRVAST